MKTIRYNNVDIDEEAIEDALEVLSLVEAIIDDDDSYSGPYAVAAIEALRQAHATIFSMEFDDVSNKTIKAVCAHRE